jgi:hypothetical protein
VPKSENGIDKRSVSPILDLRREGLTHLHDLLERFGARLWRVAGDAGGDPAGIRTISTLMERCGRRFVNRR